MKYSLLKSDYSLLEKLPDDTEKVSNNAIEVVNDYQLPFPLNWYRQKLPWIRRTSISTFDLIPGIYPEDKYYTKVTSTVDTAGNATLSFSRYRSPFKTINSYPEQPTTGLTVNQKDDYTITDTPEALLDTYNESNVQVFILGEEFLVDFVNGTTTPLSIGVFGKKYTDPLLTIKVVGASYTDYVHHSLNVNTQNIVVNYIRAKRGELFKETDWMFIRHKSQLDGSITPTLTTAQYQELLSYAQALRDFPTTVDSNVGSFDEIVWPTKPSFME